MEIKVLKRSRLKRNILIGVVVVGIIAACILTFTRAQYRNTQSIPLVNGIINYSLADLNIVAITVDGEETDTLPEGNYELLDSSYCTIDGEDANLTIDWDTETQTLTVSPFTTKGTKCYLDFEEKLNAGAQIIATKTIDNSRSGAITGTLTTNTTGTVFSVEDDYGTSYVYAGAPTDNWVYFAGFYWRIIRINGDGSIRMVYNGTSTAATGISAQIQTSVYNSSVNDNAYIGYMYGSTGASSYSATHTNTTNSTIKGIVDSWYKTNIVDKNYSDSISKEQGFCNDRVTQSGILPGYGNLGYGTNATGYAPAGRLISNGSWRGIQTPTLKCSQTNDYFTVGGSSRGNHELTYPIGLITSDEVILAGGFGSSNNISYYLYTGQNYWTMSPSSADMYGNAYVFYVDLYGNLYGNYVSWAEPGVRPVINLKADVTISSGNGTSSNPYVI